jgi:hypothetical protein
VPPQRLDHPISLSVDDDLRRSRLTVFFRLPLAIPHIVWLSLWGIAVFFAAIATWFATLAAGRPPAALHRFLSAYVRYATHVSAFFWLTGNPFPGFVGKPGSYPVDLQIAPPERQNRWRTGFRVALGLPAIMIVSATSDLLLVAGFLGWFVALFTARMPEGLRNAGAYALRYAGQAYGYLLLLTDRYPHASPGIEAGARAAAEPPTAPPQADPAPP